MNHNSSPFLQFVKNDMIKETKNNYQPVIIKALIESGLNEIKNGKSRSYMAKPPTLSTEEIHEKLIQANIDNSDFDVETAVKTAIPLLKQFVSISSTGFGLTLEFNAHEIPEILKICEQDISLK